MRPDGDPESRKPPSSTAKPKQTRPGGRTERVRKAVADSVLQLIRESGLDFGVEEVVRLSGIGRATVFRRWPDRPSLIGEALAEHTSRFEVPPTTNWQDHLHAVADALTKFFQDPVELRFNHAMLSAENSYLNEKMPEYWKPIIAQIIGPLDEAKVRDEIDKDVDVEMVVMTLTSALLLNSLMGRPANQGVAARVVAQICRGVIASA